MANDLKLDVSHTRIEFTVAHLVVSSVRGQFDKFEGTAKYDEKTSRLEGLEVKIQTASVNTNEAKRDDHLRSAEFFDADKFPVITFVQAKPATVRRGVPVLLSGTLTMRGVSKPVNVSFTYKGSFKDPWGNMHQGFDAAFKINRKDFGLLWNKAIEGGGVMVGDEVEIKAVGETLPK
ncbi:MAG: YceI family protein [Leptospirales bacterium]|nr:YceI family protein [Leptospirales bacterium]